MLFIWTAKLKEGKEKAYKAWALKNKSEYEKRVPKGWRLIGAYGTTMALAKFDIAWLWQFKRWSDVDALYDVVDKTLDKLSEEENRFLLPGTQRGIVVREMEDWLEPITKKKK